MAPKTTPQPAPAVEPAPALLVPITNPSPTRTPLPDIDADLLARIKRLTPDQRARVRQDADIVTTTAIPQPDGSVQVMITVGVDCIEQIRTWAEEAGKSFEDQVRELVDFLLIGYLNSGGEPQAATTHPNPNS